MSAVVFRVDGTTVQQRKQAAYKLEYAVRPRGGRDVVYAGRGMPTGYKSQDLRPRFTLYTDLEGRQPLCVVARPVTGRAGGDRVLLVIDPQGATLGAVHMPTKREWWRQRHEIRLPRGDRLSGRVGTIPSWIMFALLSPLWLVVNLMLAVSQGGLDDMYWSLPKRTAWRPRPGGTSGLSPLKFYGLTERYKVRTHRLDLRVAYAQAVLHHQVSPK